MNFFSYFGGHIMRKLYNIYIFLLFSFSGLSQNDTLSFPETLKIHLRKYNIQSDDAYENKDLQRGQILFDSLVSHHLIGTQFEDYTLKRFKKKKIKLSSFKKPLFILTYATWCVPSEGEIPALNRLAEKYSDEVQFIVLFWDKKHLLRKVARAFNHQITVCYANESYKNDAVIVAHLKHTLGLPTSYFLNENLQVVNIRRGGAQPDSKSSYDKAFSMNYSIFRNGLSSILIHRNLDDDSDYTEN